MAENHGGVSLVDARLPLFIDLLGLGAVAPEAVGRLDEGPVKIWVAGVNVALSFLLADRDVLRRDRPRIG